MSNFSETVQKIASSSWKRRVFSEIPRVLFEDTVKEAAKRDKKKNTRANKGRAGNAAGAGGAGGGGPTRPPSPKPVSVPAPTPGAEMENAFADLPQMSFRNGVPSEYGPSFGETMLPPPPPGPKYTGGPASRSYTTLESALPAPPMRGGPIPPSTSGWPGPINAKIPGVTERLQGLMTSMFGPTGHQEILRDIAKNTGNALVLGAGGYGAARLLGGINDMLEDNRKARQTVRGKLMTEQDLRQQALAELTPLHESTYQQVMADPLLAKADPALIASSFETMKKFAPTLSTDPNAARSFLQEVALYGKGPSYATLKTLADTEAAVTKAGG